MHHFGELMTAASQQLRLDHLDGIPLVTYNSSFIPEELVRAAGANTFMGMRGGDYAAAEAAMRYTLPCINPLARSMVSNIADRLDPVIPAAELNAIATLDNHDCRMAELIEYLGKPVYKVGVPIDREKPVAFEYYVHSLKGLIAQVEVLTGKKLDQDKAKENFCRTNRINAAFRKIDEYRKTTSRVIPFGRYMRLQHISYECKTEEQVHELEVFVDKVCSAESVSTDAPRILFMGHAVAPGDYMVTDLIDELACNVVAQFLDEGIRAYEDDVPTEGNLIENFARARWLTRVPACGLQPSWEERFAYAEKLLEEFQADGIIWYQLKNDETYDMEYDLISRRLKERRIPIVRLETDYDYSPQKMSQLKAHLSAFLRTAQKVHNSKAN